jgi:hypothetical protein
MSGLAIMRFASIAACRVVRRFRIFVIQITIFVKAFRTETARPAEMSQ